MALQYNRTEYNKGANKVFHFVPNASSAYNEIINKYGPEFVFRGNGATDGAVLTKILGQCVTGANDIIRLYPGTFVAGAVVDIAKIGVTIEGAGSNANAVVWDCDTTNCAAFTISAAGVTLRDFTIDEENSGTVDTISSTSAGTVIDGLVIRGGNIASTTATITLTGDYSIVKNCRIHLIRKGISVGGEYSFVENCWIDGSDGTAGNFGVTVTGAAAKLVQVVRGCTIAMSGSTNPKAVVVGANADLAFVNENLLLGAGDQIAVQTDTYGVANLDLTATITATPGWVAE